MNKKLCIHCGVVRPLIEFHFENRAAFKRARRCKYCQSLYVTQRQRALKLAALDYLGGVCARCGYSACPGSLEFHHKDSTAKEFTISSRASRQSGIEDLKTELDKCEILCSNCHRQLHYEQTSAELAMHQTIISNKPFKVLEASAREPLERAKKYTRKTKIVWPSDSDLEHMLWTEPAVRIALKLGISDTAICKHCARRRIKKPPVGYWAKTYANTTHK